jgi:cell division protein FtsN
MTTKPAVRACWLAIAAQVIVAAIGKAVFSTRQQHGARCG